MFLNGLNLLLSLRVKDMFCSSHVGRIKEQRPNLQWKYFVDYNHEAKWRQEYASETNTQKQKKKSIQTIKT